MLQIATPVSRLKAEILRDNPISYWRCNPALGATTATDTQGTVNGTYTSAAANGIGRQGPTPGDPTSGAIGIATPGTGGQHVIDLPTTSAFNVGPPFTVEFLVMTKSTVAATIVQLLNPSAPANGYGVGVGHITAGQIDVQDSAGAVWRASGVTVNDGNWHHIVVVFSNGTGVTIYKDGVSAGTVTLTAAPTPYSGPGMLLVAAGSSSPPYCASEIAVYNGALSASRIAAHYNATLINAASDRIELLTASQAWEGAANVEPNLYWDGTKWCMIYRGSWSSEAIGYATCTGSDPTIPGNWTKYASNPIIGNGSGGFANKAYTPSIFFDAGNLYVTFTDASSGTGAIYIASGTDALHLGTPTVALANSGHSYGNMWQLKNGSTYYLFYDQQDASGNWQIGVATASTAAGPYTVLHYPFSISDGQAGGRGGSWCYLDGNGLYHLWYQGMFYGSPGDLPTEIFKATSSDLVNWTSYGRQLKRSHVHEYDQTADPQFVIPGTSGAPSSGPVYMLWDGDDNVSLTASIFIARTGVMPVAP